MQECYYENNKLICSICNSKLQNNKNIIEIIINENETKKYHKDCINNNPDLCNYCNLSFRLKCYCCNYRFHNYCYNNNCYSKKKHLSDDYFYGFCSNCF